jgi:hypothetical protein
VKKNMKLISEIYNEKVADLPYKEPLKVSVLVVLEETQKIRGWF